jgi:hypothetical protein
MLVFLQPYPILYFHRPENSRVILLQDSYPVWLLKQGPAKYLGNRGITSQANWNSSKGRHKPQLQKATNWYF